MRHIHPDVSTICVELVASMGAFLFSSLSLLSANISLREPSLVEGSEFNLKLVCMLPLYSFPTA